MTEERLFQVVVIRDRDGARIIVRDRQSEGWVAQIEPMEIPHPYWGSREPAPDPPAPR